MLRLLRDKQGWQSLSKLSLSNSIKDSSSPLTLTTRNLGRLYSTLTLISLKIRKKKRRFASKVMTSATGSNLACTHHGQLSAQRSKNSSMLDLIVLPHGKKKKRKWPSRNLTMLLFLSLRTMPTLASLSIRVKSTLYQANRRSATKAMTTVVTTFLSLTQLLLNLTLTTK